jgi:hypothetical protein
MSLFIGKVEIILKEKEERKIENRNILSPKGKQKKSHS